MKKLLPISIILIFWFAGIANAQSAKEAIEALKKLESRVQVGISYKDYGPALGDTHYKVKMFLESPDSNKNPMLTKSLKKALDHFIYAKDIWGYKISSRSDMIYTAGHPSVESYDSVYKGEAAKYRDPMVYNLHKREAEGDKRLAESIMKKYPVRLKSGLGGSNYIYIPDVLSVIWNEASKEIQSATKLLYAEKGITEDTESEIESTPRPSKLKTKR